MTLESHKTEFKILECQNPEFMTLESHKTEFKILGSQNPELRILESQNSEFKILDGQSPELKINMVQDIKLRPELVDYFYHLNISQLISNWPLRMLLIWWCFHTSCSQ